MGNKIRGYTSTIARETDPKLDNSDYRHSITYVKNSVFNSVRCDTPTEGPKMFDLIYMDYNNRFHTAKTVQDIIDDGLTIKRIGSSSLSAGEVHLVGMCIVPEDAHPSSHRAKIMMFSNNFSGDYPVSPWAKSTKANNNSNNVFSHLFCDHVSASVNTYTFCAYEYPTLNKIPLINGPVEYYGDENFPTVNGRTNGDFSMFSAALPSDNFYYGTTTIASSYDMGRNGDMKYFYWLPDAKYAASPWKLTGESNKMSTQQNASLETIVNDRTAAGLMLSIQNPLGAQDGVQASSALKTIVTNYYTGDGTLDFLLKFASFAHLQSIVDKMYVPSLSELAFIMPRLAEINSRLDALHAYDSGINKIDIKRAAWTSTQATLLGAWGIWLFTGEMMSFKKTAELTIIPFLNYTYDE